LRYNQCQNYKKLKKFQLAKNFFRFAEKAEEIFTYNVFLLKNFQKNFLCEKIAKKGKIATKKTSILK
jgi:hypothetical protein